MKGLSGSRLLILIAAVALLWLFLGRSAGGPKLGTQAPDFTLSDLSGRKVRLSEFRGRVVLLDFWATWCESCQTEIPALKEIHSNYGGERFILLAAAVDQGDPADIARFAQAQALPYAVLLGDYPTARAYGVSGIPTKYLIGPDGVMRRRYIGEADIATLSADIQALLENKS
ncbi:MAG: TlpA disulfide reductase family protein [Elusimicrobiota bacterium]|jgi:thiol-disulfide isomerase/thioredoxin